jgi:hypothetical protein
LEVDDDLDLIDFVVPTTGWLDAQVEALKGGATPSHWARRGPGHQRARALLVGNRPVLGCCKLAVRGTGQHTRRWQHRARDRGFTVQRPQSQAFL